MGRLGQALQLKEQILPHTKEEELVATTGRPRSDSLAFCSSPAICRLRLNWANIPQDHCLLSLRAPPPSRVLTTHCGYQSRPPEASGFQNLVLDKWNMFTAGPKITEKQNL